MEKWLRLGDLLCVILNSIVLFAAALTHHYFILSFSAFILVSSGRRLLAEVQDKNDIS